MHPGRMVVNSTAELVTALATGAFEAIIGTPESEWLDFKEQPYALNDEQKLSNKGKWELAKDVAGFANHQGGYLLLGIRAEQHDHSVVETAAEVRRIKKSVVDTSAYQDVIDSWGFPRVRGVTMKWFPEEVEEPTGLLLIEVPPQNKNDKLFVIRRVFEDNRVHAEGRLAIPMREGDRTELINPEQVQRWVSDGFRGGGHLAPAPSGIPTDAKARLQERVAEIETRNGWEEKPIYVLQAVPPANGPRQLPDFYDRHGLWKAISDPESLRESGFNLRHGSGLEPVAGGWFVGRSSHHAMWLDEDGLFTVVGLADVDFLGWALNDRRDGERPDKMIVNPLTLIEFTYEFFRFVYRELRPARVPDGGFTLSISASRKAVSPSPAVRPTNPSGFGTRPCLLRPTNGTTTSTSPALPSAMPTQPSSACMRSSPSVPQTCRTRARTACRSLPYWTWQVAGEM